MWRPFCACRTGSNYNVKGSSEVGMYPLAWVSVWNYICNAYSCRRAKKIRLSFNTRGIPTRSVTTFFQDGRTKARTQQTLDVGMKSYRRFCDVVMSNRRRYNVILMSYARWVAVTGTIRPENLIDHTCTDCSSAVLNHVSQPAHHVESTLNFDSIMWCTTMVIQGMNYIFLRNSEFRIRNLEFRIRSSEF